MIQFEHVHKALGGRTVLDGIDLEIRNGETTVIIGRSGCGKSVMLKHIIGLLYADSGAVTVDGLDVAALANHGLFELRRKFGVLFQSGALINWLSVYDNVALPLREHTKLSAKEIDKTVREKLALLDLEQDAAKMPSDLSGGMRKRAGLARAIVLSPQNILYDEPTSGLDPVMAARIDELIIHVKKSLGVTSVVVTHDMPSAYRVGDRIAMLYGGKIIEVGTPDEIRKTKHPVVRQFIEGQLEGPME